MAITFSRDVEVKSSKAVVKVRPCGQVSTFGRHFLTYLHNAWTYSNETYHNYSLTGPHDSGVVFKVTVQRSRSQITFSENALFRWKHMLIDDSLTNSML